MPLPLPTSQAEIDRIVAERLPVAFAQAKTSPFHAARFEGIEPDQINDPDVWRRVPVLDKDELRVLTPRRFMDDFNIAPRETIMEYWRSGGSTGKPLFYPRTFADMEYMRVGFRRGIELAGIGPGDTIHLSYPLGIHPIGHMQARICQALGAGVNWAGSGANTPSALQVELIDQMQPTVWMGMSGYALHLANLAEAQGFDLAGSSVTKIQCSAEALSKAKRDKMETLWGAEVFDGFGMTEMCMMGGEDHLHDGFRMWSDMFFMEVLDPESYEPVAEGEEGVLVSTGLWNTNATPFIRWNSGDLVTMRAGGDSDRFGIFPRMKHAHRTAGFWKVRGININHADLEDFMFANPSVQDFKCEVVTDGDLDALRVSYEARREADKAALADELADKIKNTFELKPELVQLDTGILAKEFEGSVKTVRFIDKRG
jgi:phenylacetate-CoA ligase